MASLLSAPGVAKCGLPRSTFRSARMQSSRMTACSATHKVCLLPGDGIGPEIMDVAVKVLNEVGRIEGESFLFTKAPIGGAAIDATGDPYPAETERMCKEADAVLLSCIGG